MTSALLSNLVQFLQSMLHCSVVDLWQPLQPSGLRLAKRSTYLQACWELLLAMTWASVAPCQHPASVVPCRHPSDRQDMHHPEVASSEPSVHHRDPTSEPSWVPSSVADLLEAQVFQRSDVESVSTWGQRPRWEHLVESRMQKCPWELLQHRPDL